MKNTTYIKKLFGSQAIQRIKEEFEYDNQKQMNEDDHLSTAVFLHSIYSDLLIAQTREEAFNTFIKDIRRCFVKEIQITK